MFNWFRAKCPLETSTKLGIEQRMAWLARVFGVQRLRQATVVLPTPEFFPDPYRGAPADARPLLHRVCGYMGIEPTRFDLEFFTDYEEQTSTSVGEYVPGAPERLRVRRSQLNDPLALTATLAHFAARALLRDGGREALPDERAVADLLTVFLGLGVFGANSVIRESYESIALSHSWSIRRQGALSEPMFGYALALFAWVRDESRPAWASHLRPHVRAVFDRGLNYLRKTGDAEFRVDEEPLDEARRRERRKEALRSSSSGARLAALREWNAPGSGAEEVVTELIGALRDPDSHVRAEAANVLGLLGPAAGPAVDALTEAARQTTDVLLHGAAVAALGRLALNPESVVPVLVDVLAAGPSRSAIWALGRFGPAAAPALRRLTALLEDPRDTTAAEAAQALGAIGAAAAEAVPELIHALETGEGALPHAAALALGEIGLDAEGVVAALEKALTNPTLEVRKAAREALGRLRPSSAGAAPLAKASFQKGGDS
jgi:hypothetical protein